MIQLAQPLLIFFSIGVLFLAFDIRSRDIRHRIFEAIDSRPISNIELVAGRLSGIVLLLFIAASAIVGSVAIYSALGEAFDFGFGSTIDSVSVLAFLTWDVVPNIFLWGSLTIFLSLILRFRLIVVVVVLVLLFVYYRFHATMPLFLTSGLSTFSGAAFFPSELAPQFVNRLMVMVIAVALIALSASIHSRNTAPVTRNRLTYTGLCTLAIGVLGVYGIVAAKITDQDQVENWASVHQEHQFHADTNIDKITGVVEIKPGKVVKLNLVLAMASSTSASENRWLFSLNPGYRIEQVAVEGAQIDNYEFNEGLLSIPRPTDSDTPSEVQIVAEGTPNPLFSYLDSALNWSNLDSFKSRRLFRLGQKPYVFHSKFFALMPGVSWLPTSGSMFGKSVLEKRPSDFFSLDLEVVIPKGWLVAGPGSREEVRKERNDRYRFNPPAPIPEVALIGSQFERRTIESGGIEFELLLSKRHTKNLQTFEAVVPALQEWLDETTTNLRDVGLEYPLDTLSFVEVPVSLRVFGDGWDMDSVYTAPGIQMIRESGFPIAAFERALAAAEEKFEDSEKEVGVYLLGLMKHYFQNDLYGGNPVLGLGKQFVSYQTRPYGSGATALNYVVEELVSNLVIDSDGFFSVYSLLAPDIGLTLPTTSYPDHYFARNFLFFMRSRFVDTPQVWELALNESLAEMDFESNPRDALHVLELKGRAIAQSVLETYSLEEIGAVLRDLSTLYRGQTYSQEEFFRTASVSGVEFGELLGDWLNTTDLPGFVATQPKVELVEIEEEMKKVFQTSFELRNTRPVPGTVGVYHDADDHTSYREEQQAEPIHLPGNSAVRVALHTASVVNEVTLRPRLSLNRIEIRLRPRSSDGLERVSEQFKLPYVSNIEWSEPQSDTIVVDDLDVGFSIIDGFDYSGVEEKPWTIAQFFGNEEFRPELNYGLPSPLDMDELAEVRQNFEWYRQRAFEQICYGKYYKTYVVSPDGFDQSKPNFSAELPMDGKWKLEFYVPDLVRAQFATKEERGNGISVFSYATREFGIHKIDVDVGNGIVQAQLDLAKAKPGWNTVGTYETHAQTVQVTLREVVDGAAVVDAIKWTPVDESLLGKANSGP